jgi:hypothetical protein
LLLLLLRLLLVLLPQDAAASESMDAAMHLIHLNALMRQAVKLIKGVQLSIEEDRFKFAVFSAISWFKVRAGAISLGGGVARTLFCAGGWVG